MSTSNLYVEKTAIIKVSGKDAGDFLHRLTTQDFKTFKEGEKRNAALLKPTSHILYLFNAELKNDEFLLSVEAQRAQGLAEELEKMHFAEDLKIEVLDEIEKNDKASSAGILSEDERIQKGLVKFGVDISEKNLILETPLNSYLHRNKGCYPGQEVVERVFTYGQVAKKLVGLKLGSGLVLKPGDEITHEGKRVGIVTSVTSGVAFAMVQKSHYSSGSQTDQGVVFALSDSF